MTIATQITVLRILLIPIFAGFFLEYAAGHREGNPDERLRWIAVAVFVIAAISDGIDGYIARRFNQMSELGAILDPIADKGLLVTGLVILTISPLPAPWRFPLWFAVLVVSRDVLIVLGYAVLHYVSAKTEVKPNFTGKTATALQMLVISTALMQPSFLASVFPALLYLTAFITALSFVFYMADAIRRLSETEASKRL